MSWVERPAISTNRSVIAALLDDLLRAVVMEVHKLCNSLEWFGVELPPPAAP
jgi:hypothetical protein